MKKLLCKPVLTLALILASPMAHAQVSIEDPWIAATVSVQKSSVAFMKLKSEQALTLVRATSPAAGLVELHTMSMDNGVMKMRPVPSLPLPAGQTVTLTRSGLHLMVMDLKQQLKPGETIPLTLTFESTDKTGKRKLIEQKVMLPVRDQTQAQTQIEEPAHKH